MDKHADDNRSVYRLDFVLASTGEGAQTTSFTMNLQENENGMVMIGKNVTLNPPSTAAPGSAPTPQPASTARQDVGIRIKADYRQAGEDLLLDVDAELSAVEAPSSIRKVVTRSKAFAAAGKPSLIATLDDDHKHYQLTVTPTKLR
jgi:hypothetical protein